MQFNPALKQTFLYRLFVHSKTGFGVVLFILIFYSVTFSKRMGMIFFPYNNMFTVDFTKTNQAFTYAVKINGEMIPITGYLYWKKDFLESSLTTYVEYIENGYTLYLESYLKSKRAGNSIVKNLLPQKELAAKWPLWFARFAHHSYSMPAKIEILQYNYVFKDGKAVLTDSGSIYKNYFK